MANEFSNNAKTKIIAQEVANEMPYLRKAKSYIPQEQMVGKKYGNEYTVYIPDPGKARIAKASDGRAGLAANVEEIKEVRYPIACEAGLSDVELDEWEKCGDIESFTDQIGIPHARNIAQTIEKYAVDKTIFDASQAVVGTQSLATIAKANGLLKKAGNAGSKVTYIDGVIGNEIAAQAAGQIKNDAVVNDFLQQHVDTILRMRTIAQFSNIHTGTSTHVLHIRKMSDIIISIVNRSCDLQFFCHVCYL